jgi:nucleotide-binding universal stress UspA family protein
MSVVVGVDGSPKSHAAIRAGLEEARYRGVPLLAVMAYDRDTVRSAPAVRPVSTLSTQAELGAVTEATLRQVVRAALGEEPPDVQLRAIQGMPGHALIEVAHKEHAKLVVLAARRDGAMSRLLGQVSQYVLRNAPCPILVVPAGAPGN